jgi:hypothetical protein
MHSQYIHTLARGGGYLRLGSQGCADLDQVDSDLGSHQTS